MRQERRAAEVDGCRAKVDMGAKFEGGGESGGGLDAFSIGFSLLQNRIFDGGGLTSLAMSCVCGCPMNSQ